MWTLLQLCSAAEAIPVMNLRPVCSCNGECGQTLMQHCFVKCHNSDYELLTTPDEHITGLNKSYHSMSPHDQAAARSSAGAPTYSGCDVTCHVIAAIEHIPASIDKLTVEFCFPQTPVDIIVHIAHPLLQLLCAASGWCISPVVNKQTLSSNGRCRSHVTVPNKSGTVQK